MDEHLETLLDCIKIYQKKGDDFWYLAGPMSNVPSYNIPRFEQATKQLRSKGKSIVSPVELDEYYSPELVTAARKSKTGKSVEVSQQYETMLGRDFYIISLTNCVGGIFLENWRDSRGAKEEARTLKFLDKALIEYGRTKKWISVI